MMEIPLVDLKAQFNLIKPEILDAVEQVFASTQFIQGQYVTEFENAFGKYQDVDNVIGCANGTAAIMTALKTLNIGIGDEVITTPFTFMGTVGPILELGAKPVFVDIDPKTYNIDVNKIEVAISKKTKAILPVHLYGNPVNMVRLKEIADSYSLYVIEDCAQAHLAKFNGQAVGTFGDLGAFSFYPGKNLGAYGDAGAIITKSKKLADISRSLINHGRSSKYCHEILGHNLRIDGVQAAILSVKLSYLEKWTNERKKIAALYNECLRGSSDIQLPYETPNSEHVYHIYAVKILKQNRDMILEKLRMAGIMAGVHYPIPIHQQPALSHFGYKNKKYPVTEETANKVISLPIYPELAKDKVTYISSTLLDAL